jgi:hypothetical protein
MTHGILGNLGLGTLVSTNRSWVMRQPTDVSKAKTDFRADTDFRMYSKVYIRVYTRKNKKSVALFVAHLTAGFFGVFCNRARFVGGW